MKLLFISCKKATYLLSKKEEGKLGFLGRMQLSSHLSICSVCRLFESQSNFIARHAKLSSTDEVLSSETKQLLEKSIKMNR